MKSNPRLEAFRDFFEKELTMNTMLSEALQEFTGLLKQLLTNLLGNDAEVWGDEFKKFLRREPCWADGQSVAPAPTKACAPKTLLDLLGTVAIPATTGKFVARDRFVINTGAGAPVKISYLGDNFKDWFLGKTGEPTAQTVLRYHKLRRSSLDAPIIAELGGEAKAETTLAELFALMSAQKNGEKGTLLTNGYANIFYVRDVNLVLRAVSAGWRDDGWRVDAYPVTDPSGWLGGRQVFSRNS